MTEKKITVGIIQQQNTGDIADNKKRLKQHIEQCAAKGARLVVLQELHNSLYFCHTESTDNFDLAESIPGESTEFYSRIAGELHIVLVTSLFERRAAGLYHNTAVVFDTDGSIAGKYRKMHIPDDPAYYENLFAGISGIPKQPASWRCKEPTCSSTLRPSAGRVPTPPKNKSGNKTRGSFPNEDMLLPTDYLL